jgi:hypothetical protein
MRKKVLLVAMLLWLYGESSGQSFFSIQWEVAEPTEAFADAAATGFGVKGTYMHFVAQRIAITSSAGYVKWGPRTNFPPNNEYKFVSIPVQIGMDFLLSKSVIAPYVGLSLGMNYLRSRGIPPNSPTNAYADDSELKFGFSPHVGTAIYLVGPVGVHLTGSYNIIYTSGRPSKYFGLNAGLAVGF